MKLTMLYKDQGSGSGSRPAACLAESGEFVVQGKAVDGDAHGELANVLEGETAVRISQDVILGAVACYQRGING